MPHLPQIISFGKVSSSSVEDAAMMAQQPLNHQVSDNSQHQQLQQIHNSHQKNNFNLFHEVSIKNPLVRNKGKIKEDWQGYRTFQTFNNQFEERQLSDRAQQNNLQLRNPKYQRMQTVNDKMSNGRMFNALQGQRQIKQNHRQNLEHLYENIFHRQHQKMAQEKIESIQEAQLDSKKRISEPENPVLRDNQQNQKSTLAIDFGTQRQGGTINVSKESNNRLIAAVLKSNQDSNEGMASGTAGGYGVIGNSGNMSSNQDNSFEIFSRPAIPSTLQQNPNQPSQDVTGISPANFNKLLQVKDRDGKELVNPVQINEDQKSQYWTAKNSDSSQNQIIHRNIGGGGASESGVGALNPSQSAFNNTSKLKDQSFQDKLKSNQNQKQEPDGLINSKPQKSNLTNFIQQIYNKIMAQPDPAEEEVNHRERSSSSSSSNNSDSKSNNSNNDDDDNRNKSNNNSRSSSQQSSSSSQSSGGNSEETKKHDFLKFSRKQQLKDSLVDGVESSHQMPRPDTQEEQDFLEAVEIEEKKQKIEISKSIQKKNESIYKREINLKKSHTEYQRNQNYLKEDILQKQRNMIKMLTHKDIGKAFLLDIDYVPKTYVYLVSGLSHELFDDDDQNYRNAFFENDQDLENYHKQLKEALVVQFQKEINISHAAIKSEYEKWVQNFQRQYAKTSPHKKTLVFDLDETLVRAQKEEPENGYDSRITVIDQESYTQYYVHVKFRPHLLETLTILQQHYELILFTAASEQYADIVLQTFEGHQYFDHVLSRKQCLNIFQYKVYVKDLTILLNNRNLKDILIVDNKVESYSSNLENGIPITSYFGQEDDDMLQKLTKYLLRLKHQRDVRQSILKDFFLNNLADITKEGGLFGNGGRIDTQIIKDCVLKARQNSTKQPENLPLSQIQKHHHAMNAIVRLGKHSLNNSQKSQNSNSSSNNSSNQKDHSQELNNSQKDDDQKQKTEELKQNYRKLND